MRTAVINWDPLLSLILDELEDISLKCLDPIAYAEIENSLALCKEDREKFISTIKKKIMK